ncbi:MAG: hypothetical protein C6I00_06510 [Nitratiruptor sp.]|nr:hypothetical protein [Nitratiruptor sp.]NPA83095.1 hypothetical protein [Campylobacterota bacterium]
MGRQAAEGGLLAARMPEVVLVITVVGVLAAIALPKFDAVRQEAQISRTLYLVRTATNEIVTYAFSQMELADELGYMSQILQEGVEEGIVQIVGREARFQAGQIDPCLVLRVERMERGFSLTIELLDPQGDPICQEVQRGINTKGYPIQLRGRFVRM